MDLRELDMSVAFAPLDLRVDELLSVEAMLTASVSGDPDLRCVIHLAGSFGYLRMEQRSILATVVRARSGYTTRVVGPGCSAHVIEDRGPWYDFRTRVASLAGSYCKSSMVDATLHVSTRASRHHKSAGSYHNTHAHAHAGTPIESHQAPGHHVPS